LTNKNVLFKKFFPECLDTYDEVKKKKKDDPRCKFVEDHAAACKGLTSSEHSEFKSKRHEDFLAEMDRRKERRKLQEKKAAKKKKKTKPLIDKTRAVDNGERVEMAPKLKKAAEEEEEEESGSAAPSSPEDEGDEDDAMDEPMLPPPADDDEEMEGPPPASSKIPNWDEEGRVDMIKRIVQEGEEEEEATFSTTTTTARAASPQTVTAVPAVAQESTMPAYSPILPSGEVSSQPNKPTPAKRPRRAIKKKKFVNSFMEMAELLEHLSLEEKSKVVDLLMRGGKVEPSRVEEVIANVADDGEEVDTQ
jgi:hypothetical protein